MEGYKETYRNRFREVQTELISHSHQLPIDKIHLVGFKFASLELSLAQSTYLLDTLFVVCRKSNADSGLELRLRCRRSLVRCRKHCRSVVISSISSGFGVVDQRSWIAADVSTAD